MAQGKNGQTLVTRGTIVTAKHMVLRWSRGRLLNLFLISVQSVSTQVGRISLNRNACREEHTKTSLSGGPKDFAHMNKFSILAPGDNEFTCERCTSVVHTSRVQCQQHDDEGDDGCTTTPRQKFPVTNEDLVHRNKALIKFRTLRRLVETARDFIMRVALAGGK